MATEKKETKKNGIGVEPLFDGGKAIPPDVDIVEDHGNLVIHIDLPGVAPGQAKVEVDENNILSVKARCAFTEPKEELLRQFPIGDYYRAFQLGGGFDRDRIKGALADGTLVITIPRKEDAKPRLVEIKA